MPNWGDVLREFLADPADPDEAFRLPPPRVEGYTVGALLGEHGQGQVYLAVDARSGEQVAIKRWRVPSARAERELRALATLDHPGVVRVRGGAEDLELGLPCLVMDYVAGERLLASGQRLAPDAVRALAREVASALAHVHARGLVHRDVKPANLVRRADGAVVLLDFGLVRTLRPEPALDAGTGAQPAGTLPYMAPEQLGLRDDPVGPAADLYGLGATLYECLTGAVPFETNGAFERRGRDVWRDPPRGARVWGVPDDLRALISRCLAFDPADRPPDAPAVAAALEADPRPTAPLSLRGLAGVCLVAALLASTLVAPTPAASEERVVQPGPVLGQDTFVSSVGRYVNDNFGVDGFLRVGRRPATTGQSGELQALLRFDLAWLPPETDLREAWLELYVDRVDFGPGPARLEAQRVEPALDGRTPWQEGTGLVDARLDGVAWRGRFVGVEPGETSARDDLSAPPVAETVAAAVDLPAAGWLRLELTSLVRGWLDHPASNHGLRLRADPRAVGVVNLVASDHFRSDARPRLRLRLGAPAPVPPAEPAGRRAEAERQLRYALTLLRHGNPEAAFDALCDACRVDPAWGRLYAQRARVADRLGLRAVTWLDSERALTVADPDPTADAFLTYAEAWIDREGLAAPAFATVGAVVAACEPSAAARADRVLAQALARPALRASFPQPEFREALRRRLTDWSAGADNAPGLATTHALWELARGDAEPLRALQARTPAPWTAVGPNGPRAEAPAAVHAAWIRVLAVRGEVERLTEALRRARARWPDDAGLRRLEGLPRPD